MNALSASTKQWPPYLVKCFEIFQQHTPVSQLRLLQFLYWNPIHCATEFLLVNWATNWTVLQVVTEIYCWKMDFGCRRPPSFLQHWSDILSIVILGSSPFLGCVVHPAWNLNYALSELSTFRQSRPPKHWADLRKACVHELYETSHNIIQNCLLDVLCMIHVCSSRCWP